MTDARGRDGPRDDDPGREAARMRFAAVMDLGTRIAFVVLVVAFGLYVTGVLPAEVPLAELPRLWRLPSNEFLARTGAPSGWAWLRHLPHAEAVSLGAVSLLVAVGAAAFAAVIPVFVRHRARAFAWMAVLLLLVNLLAASGLFA